MEDDITGMNPTHAKYEQLTVLGRGESSREYFEFTTAANERVFIMNFVSKDLAGRSIDKLSESKVWVLGNIEEPVLKRRHIRRLSIERVFWAGLSTDPVRTRLRNRLNRYGRAVETLDNFMSMTEFQACRGTGILGLLIAARAAQHVSVYGIDFYASGYTTQSLERGAGKEATALRNAGPSIAASFNAVISSSPNTMFSVYTRMPNWLDERENIVIYPV